MRDRQTNDIVWFVSVTDWQMVLHYWSPQIPVLKTFGSYLCRSVREAGLAPLVLTQVGSHRYPQGGL